MDLKLYFLVQPQQRGYRFRYICEGSAHGPMPGESSTKENKTFPTLRIDNCAPKLPVYVLVSLCSEGSHSVHMHTLFGKNVYNGQYIELLKASETGIIIHQIKGVSILHTKAKSKIEILGCKLAQNQLLNHKGIEDYVSLMKSCSDPSTEFNIHWFRENMPYLQDYINQAGEINVANNVVCLKIQAFFFDNRSGTYPLSESLVAYSKLIYDSKAPQTAPLKIQRISRYSGSVEGNDEVYLLCDKIDKNDVEIDFFYVDNGQRHVFGQGNFAPCDVFHQVVIIFKTPRFPYFLNDPFTVKLCLRRKADANEFSPPIEYKYFPSFPPYQMYQSDQYFENSSGFSSNPHHSYNPPNPRFDSQPQNFQDYQPSFDMVDPNSAPLQNNDAMDHSSHSNIPSTSFTPVIYNPSVYPSQFQESDPSASANISFDTSHHPPVQTNPNYFSQMDRNQHQQNAYPSSNLGSSVHHRTT